MGKTTLSHALARILGLSYQRIQFTSDLLPSDVLGYSMYDKQAGALVFHPGPIFAQVVLADEINRASPRTQSALLEAMEEKQVSIEGATPPLACALLRYRHPEPGGTGRHLPAARIPARPVSHAHPPGLSGPEGRARLTGRRGPPETDRTAAAPVHSGCPGHLAQRRAPRHRQPGPARLRPAPAGAESASAGTALWPVAPRRAWGCCAPPRPGP